MTDQSKKVSQLPTAANTSPTDRVLVLRDPAGSPSVRTVPISVLLSDVALSNVSLTITQNNVPTLPTSDGVTGSIAFDNTFFYVCTATNQWKRIGFGGWDV